MFTKYSPVVTGTSRFNCEQRRSTYATVSDEGRVDNVLAVVAVASIWEMSAKSEESKDEQKIRSTHCSGTVTQF